MGWIADKVGLKKTLLIIMAAWIIVFPLLALVADFNLFVVLTIVMGFLFGASYPITRAVMSYLTPEHNLSNAFSFYTLAERFSTFLGPLVWGMVTTLLVNIGSDRYRLAILSMTIFLFLGFLILRKIPAEKNLRSNYGKM